MVDPARLPPVLVVMGGPGREAAVSRASGRAIAAALASAGCRVQTLDLHGTTDASHLPPGRVVFNIVHGTWGEDGTFQAALEAAGACFVGADSAASRLCMDKVRSKRVVAAAGLAVAGDVVVTGLGPVPLAPGASGVVVKPVADGSSVGLRLLGPDDDLAAAIAGIRAELGPLPLLVEERLAGPEYTVAVIDQAPGQPRALPGLRICPAAGAYDYEAKYERDDTRYEALDDDPVLASMLAEMALTAYTACGCRDLARVDFMADGDRKPRFLEINSLPGFTSHSLLPKAAALAGIGFVELCLELVDRAATRLAPVGGGNAETAIPEGDEVGI